MIRIANSVRTRKLIKILKMFGTTKKFDRNGENVKIHSVNDETLKIYDENFIWIFFHLWNHNEKFQLTNVSSM